MRLISGSSNIPLAQSLASLLGTELVDVYISKFPNGEKRVWIKEELDGETVAIVQSFSEPVDEHIVELALISDAAHHIGAKKIVAIVPWLGYSPQDKSFRPGEPVSIQVIAKIIKATSVDHLITVDIHSQDSLRFFDMPVSELSALSIYVNHFKNQDLTDHVVVSLDKGRARALDAYSNRDF